MIVYHYSQTLREGDRLEPGHEDYSDLCEPFVQALERGGDCFHAMLLNGKYLYAVLGRSGLRNYADYAKWAAEGVFEYVRREEFPTCASRLRCSYFCPELSDCIRMFHENFDEEEEEDRAKVRLFAIEADEESLERRDVSLFDAAYDYINEKQDTEAAVACARRYFAGEHGAEPSWEYLSAGEAVAVKDVTDLLR